MDDDNPIESDRDWIHDATHVAGTTLSGEPLPRGTDEEGHVGDMYGGKKFLLRDHADE